MNVLRRIVGLVAFAVVPVVGLSGCDTVAGDPQGLAPEDEPYLFDLSDPSFELATPCKDITDEQLQELGLERSDSDKYFVEKEGIDSCGFDTEDYGSILMNGAAYKLLRLQEDGVPLDYQPSPDKAPALAFSQDGTRGCTIAAETPRGTVDVMFTSFDSDLTGAVNDCPMAEKYFDLLIGEKLQEYRSN